MLPDSSEPREPLVALEDDHSLALERCCVDKLAIRADNNRADTA